MLNEREFKDAIDKLEGVLVSSTEIRDIIHNLRFNKGLDVKLASNDTEIIVKLNGTEYRIKTLKEDSGHREGDGGEIAWYTMLRECGEKDKDLLVSSYFVAYSTYSDDSEDYEYQNIKRTQLLQEDPLARAVFDALRQRENKKEDVKCQK